MYFAESRWGADSQGRPGQAYNGGNIALVWLKSKKNLRVTNSQSGRQVFTQAFSSDSENLRWSVLQGPAVHVLLDTRPPRTLNVRSVRRFVEQNYVAYLFLAAPAFRIIAAHFVASESDSNPKTAEYFLPTTWATTKSMLIPALAIA
jgi:hypothetical protein